MRETLEKLWEDYLLEECDSVKTSEERKMMKNAVELHENLSEILSEEQRNALEKYIDTVCEIDSIFAKKAFLKGCEFAVSFLFEAVK